MQVCNNCYATTHYSNNIFVMFTWRCFLTHAEVEVSGEPSPNAKLKLGKITNHLLNHSFILTRRMTFPKGRRGKWRQIFMKIVFLRQWRTLSEWDTEIYELQNIFFLEFHISDNRKKKEALLNVTPRWRILMSFRMQVTKTFRYF